jgi:PGAP1-like protein
MLDLGIQPSWHLNIFNIELTMPQLPNDNVDVAAATTTAATAATTATSVNNNPLMTPKALALSLSPPRAPPFGTIQRALYHHSTNKNHQQTKHLYNQILYDWLHRGNQEWHPLGNNNHRNSHHYHVREIHNENTAVPISDRFKAIHPTLQRRLIRKRQQRDENTANASRHRGDQRPTNNQYHFPRPHPHLLQKSNDRVSRYLLGLGRLISLKQQNDWRDAGIFRTIVDILATTTIPPVLLLSHPPSKILIPFLRLQQICQTIPYGPNPSYQYIHLYTSPQQVPSNNIHQPSPQPRRLIVFVHGGAWGSGQPWMYRLMAAPFLFLNSNTAADTLQNQQHPSFHSVCYSVAVIGHRTYPDGNTLQEQVSDIRTALNILIEQYSHLYDQSNITVVGHSSGAHISLCMVVEFIKEKLNALQHKIDRDEYKPTDPIPFIKSLPFDSFCGISGPYDISHHFDYESARGVEEISPMKPVNGHTRRAFRSNSPIWRLSNDELMYLYPNVESQLCQICPNIALIHGIEDDTVPFTATAEASRLLRLLGMAKVQEMYIPQTGHQDAILQCMLGGRTCNALMEWISNLHQPSSNTNQPICTRIQSRL